MSEIAPPKPGAALGLRDAVGVGVGAIVGGGVLALAGVAFATTGPGAIAAFALNGAVAALTVFAFSELASRFPENGGTYTYARKVLSVEAAFGVGWVVWFASVVAAVLYALGFAVFFIPFVEQVFRAGGGSPPGWAVGRFATLIYALGATAFYVWSLMRAPAGGGQWATVGKVAVFLVVIAGGAWVLLTDLPPVEVLSERFRPFLERGGTGLVQAMGYTFIALQGFDLIAAVAGEVDEPERNVPRAMFLSLGAALAIYLPLLFLVVAVGTPGQWIGDAAREHPETLIAVAAGNFLGPAGYWLVIVAGVLSMLSALQANLLAASRFARTMARDRTLPRRFEEVDRVRGTPVAAIQLTGLTVAFLLVAVPDVAAAGAMSSLIFMVSFALVHGISYLARTRAEDPSPFQSPAFPVIPVVGGVLCLLLGLFQAIAVPAAGALTALWISVGAVLYVARIGEAARVADASSEGYDPGLVRLRGRTPRILVPIANPASAATLVDVAYALAPHGVSRALLLSVLPDVGGEEQRLEERLAATQAILGGALARAFDLRFRPEALVTIHDHPWDEIGRVAAEYRCERLVMGVGALAEETLRGPVERLLDRVGAEVVILRAPPGWKLGEVRRVLVPSGGARFQSSVRARVLGSLRRAGPLEVTYLRVLSAEASVAALERARAGLRALAQDEAPGISNVLVERSADTAEAVRRHAEGTDLVMLGLQRAPGRRNLFGPRVVELVEATQRPLLLISQKG